MIAIITNVKQLDKYPSKTVILDFDNDVLQKNAYLNTERSWFPLNGYSAFERDFGVKPEDIRLPATVLWVPEERHF